MIDERTLEKEALAEIGRRGIAETLSYVGSNSRYYQRVFKELHARPEDFSDLDAFRQFPLTTKQDVSGSIRDFWCVEEQRVVDISTTSGTTGHPTLYPMTYGDIERLGVNEYLSFRCAGLTEHDTVILAVTMDRCFMAGLAYYEGLTRIGATTIRVGSGPYGMLLDFLERVRPTAIVSVPSYLRKIGLYAQENGLDLASSPVNRLICIGEPIREPNFSLNPLGQQIEQLWGARVYSTYGITELAISFCECDAAGGGHLHPELIYAEIVDEKGHPVPEGEIGELVGTTIGVQAMPIVRFATGDCSFIQRERCACGRWTPRLGPIVGRKRHLMKIKGTSVYPAAVQRVLDSLPQVREYVMVVRSVAALSDELTVMVALQGEANTGADLVRQHLQAALKVTPVVKVVSMEEIERLQDIQHLRKKRVFIDER
ncbi:MAG TPA: AMP-binding protein [Candidatus Hydrogenedentes bacterium]|nr:AMP-binding protein [Candidatus Hydrogenedentota bacterium]